MVPLSVLDLATVARGFTPAEALADTTRLAPVVERLGYHRLWVAEHHGMPAVASSAPAVLIGHLADATTTLRIGAGGVMLPNHSPLVVAEQFATLEALHPGRIDLGLGRAPGTDPATARAFRRHGDQGADTFPNDVVELINYLVASDGPPTRPAPVPGRGYLPETWLLGSSTFSAQLALSLIHICARRPGHDPVGCGGPRSRHALPDQGRMGFRLGGRDRRRVDRVAQADRPTGAGGRGDGLPGRPGGLRDDRPAAAGELIAPDTWRLPFDRGWDKAAGTKRTKGSAHRRVGQPAADRSSTALQQYQATRLR